MHNESQGSLGSLGGIGHQRVTLGGTAYLSITENPVLRKQGRAFIDDLGVIRCRDHIRDAGS